MKCPKKRKLLLEIKIGESEKNQRGGGREGERNTRMSDKNT